MKKMMVLCGLVLTAAAGVAQESRQDVSLSATGVFSPVVNGNGVQSNASATMGALLSYRYMLTPRSALELNYGFAQNTHYYHSSTLSPYVHTRQQEISGAYVFSMNFKNLNPFAELGVGGVIFSPLRDYGTSTLDTKKNTNVGALFGAGVAYEVSPSFDIRLGYRGFLLKTPDFSIGGSPAVTRTNKYQILSSPSIGVAYHF